MSTAPVGRAAVGRSWVYRATRCSARRVVALYSVVYPTVGVAENQMDALVIRNPAGRRIAAAWNELDAAEKLHALPDRGCGCVVERVRVSGRRESVLRRRRSARELLAAPSRPKRKRERPMRFYELDGSQYCRDCRDNLLTNAWRVQTGGSQFDRSDYLVVSDEPPLRPRDFIALGERPCGPAA
jgi:hypothetical protein